MTLITTVAELEALPAKSVVIDKDGDAWSKAEDGSGDDGRWHGALPDGATYGPEILLAWKPFVLVRTGSDGPALVSTRCCGHDCANTTPLPIGASWLCPDHGDCSADIRKEQADDEH